ncbi:hypothetical protein CMI37_02815 [Candidatus Pacearchaeota archaeon]|nr:hypothetical protein [Candidatus Pacearchaeota archaeon]
MSSPTQRSLKLMRSEGYVAAVVERYIAAIRKRQDLYGFIDLVAMHPSRKGLVGIQSTTGANLSSRYKKALALGSMFDMWITCGNTVEFHGWTKKPQKPGSKRMIWKCRRLYIDENSLRQIRCAEMATGPATPSQHEPYLQAPTVPNGTEEAEILVE